MPNLKPLTAVKLVLARWSARVRDTAERLLEPDVPHVPYVEPEYARYMKEPSE